jgi:hypothetical protein
MIKVKFFFTNFEVAVQTWLYENQEIDIISTNLTSNEYGQIYSILYKERTK